ncbi:Golgi-associated RAB2 interactor protein 4 [Marmota flaviventris]|uniref:Golgi-associated RAB2 interactor protein 4 n=1 Tax=Marmota flaviventris TaxID=93162 RepID=UPI000FFFB9D5|nr:protein FAM71A [Marmota flaviventris]
MTANSECLLPYYTAQSGSGVGMFNTTMGKLQRQLYKGEYDIFKYAPIFESDFIQITKRGEVIDVHNRVRMVTVGIACTSPILPLPDVMLLARPAAGHEGLAGRTKGKGRKSAKTMELTRLLPLKFVRISIHDHDKQQLRLKFATGRSCYLQLCPPLDAREDLFAYWEKLIYLLRPPVDSNSSTYAILAQEMICMPAFEEEDKTSLGAGDLHAKGDQDQVSIRSLHMVSEVCGATYAAYVGGEGIQHDSHKSTSKINIAIPRTKSKEHVKESVTEGAAGSGQAGGDKADATLTGARGSKTHVATAGSAKGSPKSLKLGLAANKPLEGISSTSSSFSPEGAGNIGVEPAAGKTAGEPDKNSAAGSFTPTRLSDKGGQAKRQQSSHIRTEVHKERGERRERREKDRTVSRSTHHRRGEGRHKTGDNISQKSTGRRTVREDKKGKSHSSPGGSKHSSTHKGISRSPITKESRSSHKSGRSLSTTSSGSANKRMGRISSFLKMVKANLTTKGVASVRGRDMDVTAKREERTTMEAIMETAESGQGLDLTGSVTSEVMEMMTFETHEIQPRARS